MNDRCFTEAAALLAGLSCAAMVVVPVAAGAQNAPQYQSPPQPQYQSPPPPPGQYAPAPAAGGQDYNSWLYQQTLRDYRARYAQWSAQTQASQAPPPAPAQNCESQRNSGVAAGAIIGGVAGALMGASLAGWAVRGAWALFGGSVGLSAGALLGSTATSADCQRGYAQGPGRPAYYEAGPAYAPPAYGYAQPAYAQPRYVQPGYARPAYGYGQAPDRRWASSGDRRYYDPYSSPYRRPAYEGPGYWQAPSPYYRY